MLSQFCNQYIKDMVILKEILSKEKEKPDNAEMLSALVTKKQRVPL